MPDELPQNAPPAPPARSTTIVVVEDQTIFREMLVEWVSLHPAWSVVGAHATTAEAARTFATRAVDVLLLDIGLPDEDGLVFLRRLERENPRFVVIVTAHEEPWVLAGAMASRAHAIVMKGAPLSDLGSAITRVVGGETFYCRRTAELLRRGATQASPLAALTPREREILAMVARGATSGKIAQTLGISEKTVQNHRANLMDKLGIRDVASITRFAVAQGVVSAADSVRPRARKPS